MKDNKEAKVLYFGDARRMVMKALRMKDRRLVETEEYIIKMTSGEGHETD